MNDVNVILESEAIGDRVRVSMNDIAYWKIHYRTYAGVEKPCIFWPCLADGNAIAGYWSERQYENWLAFKKLKNQMA